MAAAGERAAKARWKQVTTLVSVVEVIGQWVEGRLTVVLEVLEGLQSPAFEGTHRLVGISNLTHHLPSPVKLPLQNAFLTLAAARGLDTIIGNPARAYHTLNDGDPTLEVLREILEAEGADRLTILQGLYQ